MWPASPWTSTASRKSDFNALGGADVVNVNDLSGTSTTKVNVNLAGFDGAGDASIDTVVVNGTSADDIVKVRTADGSAYRRRPCGNCSC